MNKYKKIVYVVSTLLFTNQSLAKPSSSEKYVYVQKGENLVAVAKRCQTTVEHLITCNRLLPPYKIYIGQPLKYQKEIKQTPQKEYAPPQMMEVPYIPLCKPMFSPQLDKKQMIPKVLKRAGKFFQWPLEGKILSPFGKKKMGLKNDGINIEAKFHTPVKAAEQGVVVYSGNEIRGFGNIILLKHADHWTSTYAHNDILLVSKGDLVEKGQIIAKVGNTGNVETPQLHFELRKSAKPMDPLKLLR